MTFSKVSSGGWRNRWPLGLDSQDPKGMAGFLLGLGYERDNVANALATHCTVDYATARRIVDDVAATQQQGGH
jgi:hypothetical protein